MRNNIVNSVGSFKCNTKRKRFAIERLEQLEAKRQV